MIPRQSFVIRFALPCVGLLLAASALGGQISPELDKLLKTIESRYNHAQSLRLDFSETYASPRRPAQVDSGVLYLRKPGRMRWEYSTPPGKLFISDGKNVYLYDPESRRAEKSKLKESEDMRAPLAFLLGKLDFSKEFKSFETRAAGGGLEWITAIPKSDSLVYSQVEFLAAPDGQIRQVHITGQDLSKLDFTFSNEQQNASVPPSLFTFNPPPGVQIVEATQ